MSDIEDKEKLFVFIGGKEIQGRETAEAKYLYAKNIDHAWLKLHADSNNIYRVSLEQIMDFYYVIQPTEVKIEVD